MPDTVHAVGGQNFALEDSSAANDNSEFSPYVGIKGAGNQKVAVKNASVQVANQPLATPTYGSLDITDGGGTAQLISAADTTRDSLLVSNNGNNTIWIGKTSGITATTTAGSFPLLSGMSVTLLNTAAVYGISASGLTNNLGWIKEAP